MGRLVSAMRKESAHHRRDAAIARIAGRQHGVVTAAQLRSARISPAGIDRRIAAGHLHRVHRGVYAVGHSGLNEEGRWLAAVLASGPGAVLSHTSAARLWRILPRTRHSPADGEAAIHVTVPSRAGRARRRGLIVHRPLRLDRDDVSRRAGIPVTAPSRTLADLRRLLPETRLAAAVREAEFLGYRIDEDLEPDRTRSELEAVFLSACHGYRLPPPEVNARVDRFVVDFVWPLNRLIVEVDGWEAHRTRSAFEADRARDTRLKILGFEVVRFTWRQVTSDTREVARTIRTLLRNS
jgi:hypothetical protein